MSTTYRAREALELMGQDRAPNLWWQRRGFESPVCPGWDPPFLTHIPSPVCQPRQAQGCRVPGQLAAFWLATRQHRKSN